ncbi:MAG: hypothetical protein JXR36_03785 [Bacteroidales bacterium]|nr:hypothetical protein [Bacteroidales bacterium]
MNITPKQKAMEIVSGFRKILDNDFPRKENDSQYNFLSQCNAILCVENILKAREVSDSVLILDGDYWKKVLSELTEM